MCLEANVQSVGQPADFNLYLQGVNANDSAAGVAQQVVMMAAFAQCVSVPMVRMEPFDHPMALQYIQCSIDGCTADTGSQLVDHRFRVYSPILTVKSTRHRLARTSDSLSRFNKPPQQSVGSCNAVNVCRWLCCH
jgi:hypothetical protein